QLVGRVLLPLGEGGPKGRMRAYFRPHPPLRGTLSQGGCCETQNRFWEAASYRRAIFPSLHQRKEGWMRHHENFAKPPKQTQPGWFSFLFSIGTPPSALSVDASRHFLIRAATPPCSDARMGMSLA